MGQPTAAVGRAVMAELPADTAAHRAETELLDDAGAGADGL